MGSRPAYIGVTWILPGKGMYERHVHECTYVDYR